MRNKKKWNFYSKNKCEYFKKIKIEKTNSPTKENKIFNNVEEFDDSDDSSSFYDNLRKNFKKEKSN